jgi:hypothetical protein
MRLDGWGEKVDAPTTFGCCGESFKSSEPNCRVVGDIFSGYSVWYCELAED